MSASQSFRRVMTMPIEYTCPGCDSSVLVPVLAAVHIGKDEEMGCNNTDEHDDGDPLVMWEVNDDGD